MNILIPILTNFIILTILLIGIFEGRKNGWRLELAKLILVVGSLVGLYFLNPLISAELVNIEFCQNIIATTSIVTFKALCFACEFFIIFALISLAFAIVRKQVRKVGLKRPVRLNQAKSISPRKERRREAREFKKLNTKQISKKSKLFGLILGLILALIVGYVAMCPIKYTFIDLSQVPELTYLEKGYEYTIYGQFDKLTNLNIIK